MATEPAKTVAALLGVDGTGVGVGVLGWSRPTPATTATVATAAATVVAIPA
jgi:hypothetical protein